MEIKKVEKSNSKISEILNKRKGEKVRRKLLLWLILFILFIIISLSSIYFGASLYRNHTNLTIEDAIKTVFKTNTSVVPNFVKSLTAQPETIYIDIEYTDFQKLEYIRQNALSLGILETSSDAFVPAKISYNGEQVKADIRLKGDWVDHLQGDKWSFRIEIKGDQTLFDMKTMSIQHPKTRNYLTEWLFQKTLKKENVLALRYKFISVSLNGKDLGIYALEEHFDKQLIENQQRKEGPIIRFNEDLMWDERIYYSSFPDSEMPGYGNYYASDIDVFKTKKILEDETKKQQFQTAVNLLESFRLGKLKTSEVFDIDLLAKFLAITDLMGTEHGLIWHNIRYYYNPITSLLEPIGYDGNGGAIVSLVGARQQKDDIVEMNSILYYDAIFSDLDFYKLYVENLERLSDPLYLKELFSEIENEMNENLNILYKDFPFYYFSKDVFYNNQNYIRKVLNPTKGIQAYFNNSTRKLLTVELANIQTMPIEVISIVYNDSIVLSPESEIILSGKLNSETANYNYRNFILPEDFSLTNEMISELTINYKILGSSKIMSDNIYNWSHLSNDFIDNDFIRNRSTEKEFDFLVVDNTYKKIYIKSGDWSIDKNLIIPRGYHVVAGEGVHIDLSNNAKILSYSPLEFIGSEENPIVISSDDFSGQGLFVMSETEQSRFEYVCFKRLSNLSQSRWSLTGAVTFYESPVEFFNCTFSNNGTGDDYLNIVRSDFYIQDCTFYKSTADALDLDFSRGKIINTSFINSGNDAIDSSDTKIELQDVYIKNAGDKGISAGEGTNLIANGLEILDTEIAVSSKDMSLVTIDNINITNSSIAFAIFQKKPEYGPASVIVDNLCMNEVEIPYMVEKNSTLIVDENSIIATYEKVDEILYGIEFGKSSK